MYYIYKKILDLLEEESVSGESSGRAMSINLMRSPTMNV